MKLFREFYEAFDLLMMDLKVKQVKVDSQHKLISANQEREIYKGANKSFYCQLPDIVERTHRYAVTYYIHTFKDTVTTTTRYFGLFKKKEVKEWYKLELTMQGEPVSITFSPTNPRDTPVCVPNSNGNRSVRLFKSKDENLYSDVYKTLNLDRSDFNYKDIHKSLSVTVKEVPLNWGKIRYRCSMQRVVDLRDKDSISMVSEILIESALRSLKNEIQRDMRSGKLIRTFTNGEVKNNMLVAYEVEESVLPFIK